MKADPNDLRTLVGSILMRQGMPEWPHVTTFGTAGQLTSVAVEFHIYFFAGSIFFVLKGRSALLSFLIAIYFSTVPLYYFRNDPGSDHALFVMWMIGFGAYYVASSITIDGKLAALGAVAFLVCSLQWGLNHSVNYSDLSDYPMIGLAFFSLMVLTQKIRIIPLAAGKIITGFADYSYSLFLIHLTLMRVLVEIIPVEGVARIAVLIIASNICAFIFSILFEQHYRRVSEWIKNGITFALLKFERVAR